MAYEGSVCAAKDLTNKDKNIYIDHFIWQWNQTLICMTICMITQEHKLGPFSMSCQGLYQLNNILQIDGLVQDCGNSNAFLYQQISKLRI